MSLIWEEFKNNQTTQSMTSKHKVKALLLQFGVFAGRLYGQNWASRFKSGKVFGHT